MVAAAGVSVLAGVFLNFHHANAADFDGRAPRPRITAHGPCEMVPQPRANLNGEVIRYRPSIVCLSRGLYADRHPPPPPPPRPWWWLGW
jgi:hypothetical protein